MKSDGCRHWWLRGSGPALEEIPRLWRQWVQAFRSPAGRTCTFVVDQCICPPSWWWHSLQRHQTSPMLDGGMSRRRCRWHLMWRSFLVAMEWGSARLVVFHRCATVLAVPEWMACLLWSALDIWCRWFHDVVLLWMNWMNEFITYIPPMKPEGQAQGCILRRSMVINPLGTMTIW